MFSFTLLEIKICLMHTNFSSMLYEYIEIELIVLSLHQFAV